MNIALLSSGFSNVLPEATKITTLLLAKELKRKGHYVCIISDKRKENKRFEETEGIPVFRPYNSPFKKGPLFFIFNHTLSIAKGVKFVEKKQGIEFDIIHNFSSAPIISLRGILAKRFSKMAKLVHTLKSLSKYKLGSLKFSRILNNCDAITVQNNILKKSLIKNGCKKKINIINSHIDLKKFNPIKTEKENLVLYYGPLVKRKGTEYLIRAASRILSVLPNSKIIFLCKTKNYPKKYDLFLKKHNLEDNVKIINKKVDLVEYISKAKVVALPYPHLIATESNPSCLIESMACKTAVVTTDLPEIREVFQNEAILAKPRNHKDLADNIIEVIKNNKLRKKLEERGYKKAKEFDVKKITKEYLEVYNNLISHK